MKVYIVYVCALWVVGVGLCHCLRFITLNYLGSLSVSLAVTSLFMI